MAWISQVTIFGSGILLVNGLICVYSAYIRETARRTAYGFRSEDQPGRQRYCMGYEQEP